MFRGNLAHAAVLHRRGLPQFSAVKWMFVRLIPVVVGNVIYIGSADGNALM